jgi:hypothetical protein
MRYIYPRSARTAHSTTHGLFSQLIFCKLVYSVRAARAAIAAHRIALCLTWLVTPRRTRVCRARRPTAHARACTCDADVSCQIYRWQI